MFTCLNPYERHSFPGLPADRLVCEAPGCGFLLAGAPIGQWSVTSLLKSSRRMDLYLATVAVPGTRSVRDRVVIRVLRQINSTIFLRSKLLQTLYHAHIHPILRADKIGRGDLLALISPFEENGSLAAYLEKRSRLSFQAVGGIIHQIAEALHLAHGVRIVHGHLKPENCLLVAPGKLQVCDFYYSFVGSENPAVPDPYTAPEQLAGRAEAASDQFALASLAYLLLRQRVLPPSSGYLGGEYQPLISPMHPLDLTLRRARSGQIAERFPDIRTFDLAFRAALESVLRTGQTGEFSPARSQTLTSWSDPGRISALAAPPPPETIIRPQQYSPSPSNLASGKLASVPPIELPERPPEPVEQFVTPSVPETAFPRGATQLYQFTGHTAAILSLSWSPDGQYLASGAQDGQIRLWSVQQDSGRYLGILQGHKGKVQGLCWLPDGKHIATVSSDEAVRIWDITSGGHPESTWKGHEGGSTTMDPTTDGAMLATGGRDGVVRVWDRTGQVITRRLVHRDKGVQAVAWSPNQELLATGGADCFISVWDASLNRQFAYWPAHYDEVRALTWSPNGRYLASYGGKKDNRICIWEAQSGKLLVAIEDHRREVIGILWSSDSNWLVSAATDGSIRFWRTDEVEMKQQVMQILPSSALNGSPLLMTGSASQRRLALATKQRNIAIFQIGQQ